MSKTKQNSCTLLLASLVYHGPYLTSVMQRRQAKDSTNLVSRFTLAFGVSGTRKVSELAVSRCVLSKQKRL